VTVSIDTETGHFFTIGVFTTVIVLYYMMNWPIMWWNWGWYR